MGKAFWAVLAGVVVIMVGAFVLLREDTHAPGQNLTNPSEITAEDYALGPVDAPVTLVEYGDFQCPACESAHPLLQQLKDEYPEDVRFVWRHFPLTQVHPQAYDAARASVAAAEQGKFWEMHDLLFERQDAWSGDPNARGLFDDYAVELGLDPGQYLEAFDGASDRVDRDTRLGQELNVASTPTFYLNGEQLEQNPRNYEEFKALVEDALAATSQTGN